MKNKISIENKNIKRKEGISLITLGIIIGVLVVVALVAIGLSWYFKRDAIRAKKEEMYKSDRNTVQEALVKAATQVQEKYNVTVSISQKEDISDGIVYTLNGLNNSAITGGKMGWKSKATNATATQDTTIILGINMPTYSGVNAIWSTDSHGNIELTVGSQKFSAPEGTNLNDSLRNSLSSLGDGTNKIEEARSKKIPYVPVGFSHVSGTTVENGYVIQDSQLVPNQYVWVPVKDMNNWPNEIKEYYEKESEEYKIVRQSVENYGGFYIGRYEASNDNLRAASRADQKPWTNLVLSETMNNVNGGAAYYAKQVKSDYGYVDFKSTLIYEPQWRDILKFMNKSDDKNSTSWGNYMNSEFEVTKTSSMYAPMNEDWSLGTYQKITGTILKVATDYNEEKGDKGFRNGGWLLTTGAVNGHSIKNIYDIAGNVYEWTLTSATDDSRYIAGGCYRVFGDKVPATKVEAKKVNEKSEYIGFRVALYL